MTLEQAKQELIRRYKYLYENACFILAPFMYEETKEEMDEANKKYGFNRKEPLIYLNLSKFDSIVSHFEEFLLSEKTMEESTLYQTIESKRNDKEYLEKVKKGLALIEKENESRPYFKESINIYNILSNVCDYIEEQSGDLKNKENKLKILDEYYRIARYSNNGKIYTSGRKPNLHDFSSLSIPMHKHIPSRNKKDIGITKNKFITILASSPRYENNYSIFTESEKQEIYLQYHDELPCDLEIICLEEAEHIPTTVEERLIRPEHTNPCLEKFIIKETEIFINPDSKFYRYFQICPNCGYIVNIKEETLSNGIKQRIEERCKKDENLFRKMYLYSELFSLDKTSTKEQKKLLKK